MRRRPSTHFEEQKRRLESEAIIQADHEAELQKYQYSAAAINKIMEERIKARERAKLKGER